MCLPIANVAGLSLKIFIEFYIENRKTVISHVSFKTKHHVLSYYLGFILKFGSLIRVWTMRFESKHSYFKNVARRCKNFINVPKTIAYNHQMLQSLLLSSSLTSSETLYDLTAFTRSHEMFEILHTLGVNTERIFLYTEIYFIIHRNVSYYLK